MKVSGFNWDSGNVGKCNKHGISCAAIEDLFYREIWIGPDLKHSKQEERYLAIGRAANGRPVIVAFALRENSGECFIRPISARYMHKKELERYEETFTKDKK